jgi:hypothetical protein
MPAGNSSEQGNAVGRNLLAKLHQLSRGHPQQIGDTPDDVVLESIHFTLPSAYTTSHIIPTSRRRLSSFRNWVGEMVEIDGGPVDRSRFLQQHGGGRVVQIKMRSENSVKFRPPRLRHFDVNRRYTCEQCCGRKLELTNRGRLPFMLNESRKQSLERSEHHLGNLLVGRADAAGSASNLHEVSPLLAQQSNVRWHSRTFNTTGLRNFNVACQSQCRTVRLR